MAENKQKGPFKILACENGTYEMSIDQFQFE